MFGYSDVLATRSGVRGRTSLPSPFAAAWMRVMTKPVLVLDAMGVMFRAADDVAELLVPFLQQHGRSDIETIEELYIDASLGKLSAAGFWEALDLDAALEDEYLASHRMTPGLIDFLREGPQLAGSIWCLSNDVGEWSRKLRARFDLARYFDGFVISGDVGFRKPDRAIYQTFLDVSGIQARDAVFVDDRPRNLVAAADVGMRTVKFGRSDSAGSRDRATVAGFEELRTLLLQGRA